MVGSITPSELAERLQRGDELVLLDVREPDELAICQIEGIVSIPLGELGVRVTELDPEREIVCICHHGMRSASAAMALEQFDFGRVLNLTGGVDRWATEVDPSMRRY